MSLIVWKYVLERWADKVAAWADGKRVADKPAPNRAARDVYFYFDKDQKVRDPVDAHSLMKMVDRRVQ